MQNVSQAWKNNQNQQLLNEAYIEVTMALTDPDAESEGTVTVTEGEKDISNKASVIDGLAKNPPKYATFELNMWCLDGSNVILPDSDYGDTGYVGSLLSKSDGTFENSNGTRVYPTLTRTYLASHTNPIPGITITWSPQYDEYAIDYEIIVTDASGTTKSNRVTDNTKSITSDRIDIDSYSSIAVKIYKWCLPNRYPRILELFAGLKLIYTKDTVMSFNASQSLSVINASAPESNISFQIDNTDDTYDPNNLSGMTEYLMQRQKVFSRYGFKIDGGKQYITGGTYYLSEWDAPQNGLTAYFKAADAISFLQGDYNKGIYSTAPQTLYALATAILIEANIPKDVDGTNRWHIDDSLKNITTLAVVPAIPMVQCLQYIAQAANCIFYSDRNGILRIEPPNLEKTDYNLVDFNMYTRGEIELDTPIKQLNTKVYNYFPRAETSEIYNGIVNISGTQSVTIKYSSMATGVTATLSTGTLNSATYYANMCILNITASGDITITLTGKTIEKSNHNVGTTVGNDGIEQSIDNPILTSDSVATSVVNYVKGFISNRKKIAVGDYRSDPRLDYGDVIGVANKYGSENIIVEELGYAFNGAFHGNVRGRVLDES